MASGGLTAFDLAVCSAPALVGIAAAWFDLAVLVFQCWQLRCCTRMQAALSNMVGVFEAQLRIWAIV